MKKIKYIVELAFIFLLPLIFVALRVSMSKNFIYDNNFLIEEEETFDYIPITYLSQQETIITYNLVKYETWEFDNYTGDIYFLKTDFVYNSITDTYSDAYYFGGKGTANVYLDDNKITIYNDHEDYDLIELSIDYIEYQDYYIMSVVDFTFSFYDWDYNNGYYLMTTNTETITHYSLIITLKNLLADLILLDSDDVSYSIVFDYTCLWFLMFIIWHLVYLFVDFLLHFWHKRRD